MVRGLSGASTPCDPPRPGPAGTVATVAARQDRRVQGLGILRVWVFGRRWEDEMMRQSCSLERIAEGGAGYKRAGRLPAHGSQGMGRSLSWKITLERTALGCWASRPYQPYALNPRPFTLNPKPTAAAKAPGGEPQPRLRHHAVCGGCDQLRLLHCARVTHPQPRPET